MNGDVITRNFDWPRVEWLEHETTLTSEKGIWTSRVGLRWGWDVVAAGRKRRRTRNKYMGESVMAGERGGGETKPDSLPRCLCGVAWQSAMTFGWQVRRCSSSIEWSRDYHASISSARLSFCGAKVLRQS